jgi:hypothetical protein
MNCHHTFFFSIIIIIIIRLILPSATWRIEKNMLTIFWTLTLGPDEPIPSFWRDRHPVNLPKFSPKALYEARREQRERAEATSRARRELRRVLGVSRRETNDMFKHWRPIEALDTLFLYHLLAYPYRTLRLRYYISPLLLGSRLDHPVGYIRELNRTRSHLGWWYLWSGGWAATSYHIAIGMIQLISDQWTLVRKQQQSSKRAYRIRTWAIALGLECGAFLLTLPLYRAHMYKAMLSGTLQYQDLLQNANIYGQYRYFIQALFHPMQYHHFWWPTLPICLLHQTIGTFLVRGLLYLVRPIIEAAEANAVNYTTRQHTDMDERAQRRRRRLWWSCAWSTMYISATLVTQTILAPLDVLVCQCLLPGKLDLFHAFTLASQPASWYGIVCEWLTSVVIVQVDWWVCRYMISWQT